MAFEGFMERCKQAADGEPEKPESKADIVSEDKLKRIQDILNE